MLSVTEQDAVAARSAAARAAASSSLYHQEGGDAATTSTETSETDPYNLKNRHAKASHQVVYVAQPLLKLHRATLSRSKSLGESNSENEVEHQVPTPGLSRFVDWRHYIMVHRIYVMRTDDFNELAGRDLK